MKLMKKCLKTGYKDKISAMFALSQVRRQDARGNRQEKRVYYCPICHKWHLTSQDKRKLFIDKVEEEISNEI